MYLYIKVQSLYQKSNNVNKYLYKDINISRCFYIFDYSLIIKIKTMGVLTVRSTETEDELIEEIKKKYSITVNTKALLYAAQRCMQLEKENAELKRDRANLQAQVSDYRRG